MWNHALRPLAAALLCTLASAQVPSIVIDWTGDGTYGLEVPLEIELDADGNLYVLGAWSDTLFKVDPSGTITTLLRPQDFGSFFEPGALAVDAHGNVFLGSNQVYGVLKLSPDGTLRRSTSWSSATPMSAAHGATAPTIDASPRRWDTCSTPNVS